jgi:pentapeptide repeat protein
MDDRIKANLRGADLRGADLRGADLRGVNLRGADLRDANLRGANLRDANLRDADLRGAKLPPASVLLLANWGLVSTPLTAELMMYDAVNADNMEKFTEWAHGGPCPMADERYQRAANFVEDRAVWLKYCIKRKTAWTARKLADALIAKYTKTEVAS